MSSPDNIKAIVYTGAGGLEVIDKATLPFPQQNADEVIVKVRLSDDPLVGFGCSLIITVDCVWWRELDRYVLQVCR